MRKHLVLAAIVTTVTVGSVVPAAAATADTTTTFALTGGGLSITAPTTASLADGAIGTAASGSLGSVTVTDSRGALLAQWTATVVAGEFSAGTAAQQKIPAANVSYWSGAATATSGVPVPTPGQLTSAGKVQIDAAKTAFSLLTGVGNNSVTWSPTLSVTIPATAVVGSYTGVVTHSVA